MEKKTRDILEKPFEKKYVKIRKTAGGPMSYVEGAVIVDRLNTAFEGEWDWAILEHGATETKKRDGSARREVWVFGRLTAGGRTRDSFGGSLTPNGEVLADDLKAASTDALKKAASLFGIALDLYCDELPGEAAPAVTTSTKTPPASSAGKAAAKPTASTSTDASAALITPDQLTTIRSLQERLKWSWADLDGRSVKEYGASVEALPRDKAAKLIRRLESTIKNLSGRKAA